MSVPEFLFHYTSIEGLAHILSSKKIRFSRLDFLDDMDEGGSADILDWRKYFFVSCWSSSEEESIPLWSMYTNDMKGVRLKVKTDMFKKYRYSLDSVPSFMHLADTSSAPPGARVMLESYMPYDEMHGESYMVMPPSWRKEDWPYAIEYTNEESKLKQEILKQNSVTGQTTISYNEVARSWIQLISAAPAVSSAPEYSPKNTWAGVRYPSRFLGLSFSLLTTLRSSALVTLRKSVPLGKYCLIRPLVFSLVPRWHERYGSQK